MDMNNLVFKTNQFQLKKEAIQSFKQQKIDINEVSLKFNEMLMNDISAIGKY